MFVVVGETTMHGDRRGPVPHVFEPWDRQLIGLLQLLTTSKFA